MLEAPAVCLLASVLRHANGRIAVITDPDCIEARAFLARPDVLMCTIVADSPLPIEKVESFVSVLLGVIRSGCAVALTGEKAEEIAITAICAGVALGVPSREVVSEVATLGWIDIPSYVEFADDFREYWTERRYAA